MENVAKNSNKLLCLSLSSQEDGSKMLLYCSTTAAARFGDNPQSPENKQASMQISRPGFRQIVIIIRSSKQQQQQYQVNNDEIRHIM